MHCQKHPSKSSPASPDANLPKQRYRFDTLDWIAAFFVIAVPVYIAYQLLWN